MKKRIIVCHSYTEFVPDSTKTIASTFSRSTSDIRIQPFMCRKTRRM